jgi:hypothetical protein
MHGYHGATGGYHAFLGFVKRTTSGAVVLINRGLRLSEAVRGLSLADEIGFRVLETLCRECESFGARAFQIVIEDTRGTARYTGTFRDQTQP